MAFSHPSSLNPNADPFVYEPTFISPPILQFSPVCPIYKTPPQLRQLPVAPSMVMSAQPVHGYGAYVDPYQHQHHPMFGLFFDVVPQFSLSWPCSDGFANGVSLSQPQGSVGKNGEMKPERKCKIRKWVPSNGELMPLEATTVMIKNIPNQLRRNQLVKILDEHCKNHNNFNIRCRSEYDFVYLPMDFRKYWYDGQISNLGYAFVNFTNPTAASEFCKVFHRRLWEVSVNRKVCEIKSAKLQGLKALMEAFRNKIFWCHANNFLPIVLEPPSNGCRRYRATPVGKRVARPPPSPIKKCG